MTDPFKSAMWCYIQAAAPTAAAPTLELEKCFSMRCSTAKCSLACPWPLKRASRERMERKGTKGNEIELKGTKRNEGNEMFLCATHSASSRPSCHGNRLRRPTIVECTYTNLALDRLPQAPRIACIGVTCPMTGTLHACVFL